MQMLDYDNNENIHVCLNCDTEFNVTIYSNDQDDQLQVAYCPCCGAPLDEQDELDEMLEEFLDDQDDE